VDPRLKKQLIIGAVLIIIILAIAYSIYEIYDVEPTCNDNIQNGLEEGVDCGVLACGIVCRPAIIPLQIKDQKLISLGQGDYDFVAQVYNPNTLYGSPKVSYNVVLKSLNGNELLRRPSTFYILPGQTKFVAYLALSGIAEEVRGEMDIVSVDWQEFNELTPSIIIRGEELKPPDASNPNGSSLSGIVVNNSDYGFDRVDVVGVVFDDTQQIVGINTTIINTLVSRSERQFKMIWPFSFVEGVRTAVEAYTNIFENSNYLRNHGTQEKFQHYY